MKLNGNGTGATTVAKKFLLGYNMKIVVLWGDKNLVAKFFLVEEDYPRLILMVF